MAFLIHSTDDGRACPWEYKPASAFQPEIGVACVESSGKIAPIDGSTIAGTTKPTYICMTQAAAAVSAGTIIPVIKVQPDIIFETSFSASASSINDGDKVTIAAGGKQVTATKTSGVATIVAGGGGASGATALVRFE